MRMRVSSVAVRIAASVLFVAFVATSSAMAELIVNGDFEKSPNGAALRRDDKGQDWNETRKDKKEGRLLLKLSTKDVGGNSTKKAMVKAHPDLNTYLTQRFAEPQTRDFSVTYDIFVRKILSDNNRSAFCMIGNSRDKKRGPNSTGKERFAFVGFENAGTPGKMNLFARERGKGWDEKTIIAKDLDLGKWYQVGLMIYVEDESYEVWVEGVTDPIEVEAFRPKPKKKHRKLTHISFASWNDGAGTFYVDNVKAKEE